MFNQDKKQLKFITLTTSIALAFLAPVASGDVVLVPGHIVGNVQIGSETIDYMRVRASNSEDNAEQYLYPNVTSAPYDLTVNVPSNTTPGYTVQALSIRTRDSASAPNDYDYFYFPNQSVVANENSPVTADFELLDPNYVEGTVTLSGTGELNYMYVYAQPVTYNGFDHNTTQYSSTATRNSLDFEFPVSTGDMRCYGTAYLLSGARITLPTQTVSPVNGVVNCDWSIDTPQVGQIEGSIEFTGPDAINRIYIHSGGPTYRYLYLNSPADPESYVLDDLSVGTYSLYSYANLNNYDDRFTFPRAAYDPDRQTVIQAGDVDNIDISACQAFINGTVELIGSAGWSDMNIGQIIVNGLYENALPGGGPTYGGNSTDQINLADGSYDLTVSPGKWHTNYLYMRPYNTSPAEYINQSLYLYERTVMYTDNPANLLSCGDTVNQDYQYNMGTVTVNLSVSGGEVLSDPRLTGNCYEYDENNVLQYYYYFNSTNYIQDNVSDGSVTFVAPQGNCTNLRAEAMVAGTRTTFGELDIEVIGGGEVIIDIGGPGLTVLEPEANLCIDGTETTVSGTATDDVGVATVTVNGLSASLNPAGGDGTLSTDFSRVISLSEGANSIETIATDTSGKIGSDTRTVYRDSGAPSLSWSPADGTSTPLMSINVSGTVSDDVGIDSVTVNGNIASLTSTGNPDEYTFNVSVPLQLGSNNITVVVTEETGCAEVVEVRQVNVVENQPPVANAGGPYSVDEGSSISLDGSASSDPDGDPLTFEWDLDYNGATFEVDASGTSTPGFSAAALDGPGSLSVAVWVTDSEGESDVDDATVTINNVDPVIISVTGDTIDEDGTATVSGEFSDVGLLDSFTVTIDWGEGAPESFAYPAGSTGFSESHQYLDDNPTATPSDVYDITVTVSDDDGGSASDDSADVTVNNIAPEVGEITVDFDLIEIGTEIMASADFTDTGTQDTHSASWDWGDGTSAGTVSQGAGNGSVEDTHVYNDPGVYTIELTVTDDDSGTDSVIYQYVVVYDPNGSFVTGGGRIESPLGAFVDDPSLTGMANFGFVSKYKKGANIPTGHTEFQFQAAGLDFKSTDYEWLVVAGARAKFKGTGTIKHVEGSFGFMLTAIDGSISGGGGADKFRIKIWDADDESIIVYDNEMGESDDADATTVIDSGSIVIHNKGKK